MNKDEMNRLAEEWLGHCWHEWDVRVPSDFRANCIKCGRLFRGSIDDNPDFSTDSGAVLLLRELMKKGILVEFLIRHSKKVIVEDFILDGKLLNAVVEWIEKGRE